jgi:hypothetical protein
VNDRQLSYCPETPASDAPGLFGVVTKVFGETERSRPLVVLSLAVLSLGLMVPAAGAQTVISFLREFTGATGRMTPGNPLVGGSIHFNLSQGGWTL